MASDEQSMRSVYARYFFALFEARLNQDDAGHQSARQDLENSISSLSPAFCPPDGMPGSA